MTEPVPGIRPTPNQMEGGKKMGGDPWHDSTGTWRWLLVRQWYRNELFHIRVKVQTLGRFESKIYGFGTSGNYIVNISMQVFVKKRKGLQCSMPKVSNWICGRLANTSRITFQLMYHYIPPIYVVAAITDGFQSQIKPARFPTLNSSGPVSGGSAGCTQSRYKSAAKIFWAPVKINASQQKQCLNLKISLWKLEAHKCWNCLLFLPSHSKHLAFKVFGVNLAPLFNKDTSFFFPIYNGKDFIPSSRARNKMLQRTFVQNRP